MTGRSAQRRLHSLGQQRARATTGGPHDRRAHTPLGEARQDRGCEKAARRQRRGAEPRARFCEPPDARRDRPIQRRSPRSSCGKTTPSTMPGAPAPNAPKPWLARISSGHSRLSRSASPWPGDRGSIERHAARARPRTYLSSQTSSSRHTLYCELSLSTISLTCECQQVAIRDG